MTTMGDFLLESKCGAGHVSSATFRNYQRDQVEEVARTLADRCTWGVSIDPDDDESPCSCRVAHVITALSGPISNRPGLTNRPAGPKRSDTKPSMPRVVIMQDHPDSEEPSTKDPKY